MNFVSLTVFIHISGWIAISVSDFLALEAQRGEDVTVECANFTKTPSHITWFRLGSRPNASCISSMVTGDGNALFCVGFQNGRFTMTSNTVTVSLIIKQVDFSDTGLYFCGFSSSEKTVIIHATYLKVTQGMFTESPKLISLILAGVIILLLLVIGGLVKITKRPSEVTSGNIFQQLAPDQEQDPQRSQTLGSEDLNYAAFNFKAKPKTARRPASERLGADVVYR